MFIDQVKMRSLAMMVDRNKQVYEAAKYYAEGGNKVIPVYPNTKTPAIEGSREDAGSNSLIQIDEWFGPGGSYEGGNLALLIDDYTVVDVDNHKDGKNGFETLGPALDSATCPAAKTPGGGRHLLVRHKDLKDKDGVDILKPGKWFNVFPSMINGGMYQWTAGGGPGELPKTLVTKLGGKNSPERVIEEPIRFAPIPYVQELLNHLEPDCAYDEWLKVGMAIHSNDSGPAGLDLWDTWSREGTKYQERECERKWGTFDTGRGDRITLKWLVFKAVENGYILSAADSMYSNGSIEIDLLVNEMNKKYACFDSSGKLEIIYMKDAGKGTKEKCVTDVYNLTQMLRHLPKIPVGKKEINPVEVWMDHPSRRNVKQVGMWYHGKEPPDAFNTWDELPIKPVECTEDDIREYLDFVLNIICSGNVTYYEYLLDLLAKKLQNPLQLPGVSVVLHGGEGTGKGAFCGVLEGIFGRVYASSISDKNSLVGDFTGGTLSNKLLIISNEIAYTGNKAVSQRMKAIITEPTIDLNAKNRPQWTEINRMMAIMTTNEEWAADVSIDSRRTFVLKVSEAKKQDPTYWVPLTKLIGMNPETYEPNSREYLGKIRYFFEHRTITNDLSKAMVTEHLQKQRLFTSERSTESVILSYLKETFCVERGDDHVMGAGGMMMNIIHKDGKEFLRTENLDKDYRKYVADFPHNTRTGHISELLTALDKIEMLASRPRKAGFMEGNRPMDGNGTSKINVRALFGPEETEEKLMKAFPTLHRPEVSNDE